jgi:multidrug transporter EmrE-like cation transporter
MTVLMCMILSLIGVVGDFFVKLATQGSKWWLLVAIIIWASVAFGWYYVYQHMRMSTSGALYGIFSILFLVAFGVLYFKEHLSVSEIFGIILAFISLFLLRRLA